MKFYFFLILFLTIFAEPELEEEQILRSYTNSIINPEETTFNVIELNYTSFDKIINGEYYSSIMFYGTKNCPYCKAFGAIWKHVSETVGEEPLLRHRIRMYKIKMHEATGLGKYVDKKSVPEGYDIPESLIDRYNVDDDQIRVVNIERGSKEGQIYHGGYTYDEMIEFYTLFYDEKAPGNVPELTELINDFYENQKILTKMEKIVDRLKDEKKKWGEYYIKTAKRIIEKGYEYVNNEQEHLKEIIKNRKRSDEQLRDVAWKLNIVEYFDKNTF